ncbi:hypothetical protein Glove_423g50 [Diversispora epigaea]|uniref:Uncharacterized protein n=1 Tax=Diversispora epigaea TaxID=1348612 RepID=A0A397H2Z2_9GLOM|nr:hypothetical protein Glove_423g50 [Diversispora epigaea]
MNVNLFHLPDVICEILKRCFKTKSSSVEAIIIEYQLYINYVQKDQRRSWADARDYFKSLLREIGSVTRDNMMIKTESGHAGNSYHKLNGKYFIIPICTGTQCFLTSMNIRGTGRNLVVQGLKLGYLSDLNNENIEKLSTEFCNFVLNQQHFHIAIFDTGFIPKFILGPSVLTSDFDWGNQLFTKISKRTVAVVGDDPGNWKSLNDIHIYCNLIWQLVKREFLLPSRTSIGELERAGLLLVSQVETVFPDHLLLIPTYNSPWQWQNFELLYVYYQKAIIDSLIEASSTKSTVTQTQDLCPKKINFFNDCKFKQKPDVFKNYTKEYLILYFYSNNALTKRAAMKLKIYIKMRPDMQNRCHNNICDTY